MENKNIEAVLEEIKIGREEIKRAVEAVRAKAKDAFFAMSKSIFVAVPNLSKFSWTQYTPYFNDGDECIFSADRDYPTIELKCGHETDWAINESDKGHTEWEAVRSLLSAFENDDLKSMFGDHAKVAVTLDGVDVSEYNHD